MATPQTQAQAQSSSIVYAGYGVYNQTADATTAIRKAYGKGERIFTANNNWVGDPAPGARKYLYILWKANGNESSGVTGENDDHGISVP